MTAPGGTSSRQVKIVISADVAQAIRAMAQTEQGLGNVGQQAERTQKQTSTMGDVMKGTLAAAGIQSGLSGLVSGFKGVVQSGMEFEQAQNQFQAVTGASADQMRAAGDAAKALGNDVKIPGASASSATQAMLELAKGGLTAQESMDAARGTMVLAAAAQVDGAQAAEIQANALNTFGLSADQAGRVANVLANVANKSSGEITDFSQGLAQAGTVAAGFGWSIEDTTTYLGLMANAGIKGSDAGTSLKTTMTALLNPTNAQAAALEELGVQTRDANGNMISAKDLTAQLAEAKGRMSDADFNAAAATAFGTDAVRTALVAAQAGSAGYDEMAGALTNASGAADMAAANSKGLSGIIDSLKNSVDTASQGLYTAMAPALGEVTTAATGIIGPLADGLTPLFGSVADLASGTLAPALEGVSGMLSAIAGPVSSVIGWFNELPGPVGGAVLAIGGVIALRGPLNGVISSLGSTVTGIRTGITGFATSLRTASGAMATAGVAAKGLMGALGGPIGLAIVGVATALSFMGSKTDDAAVATAGLGSAIDENTGKLKDNADAIIAKAAADSGSFDAVEKIGGSVQVYTEALKGNADAQNQMHTLLLDQATAALKNSDAWDRMVAKGLTGGKSARDIASGLLAQGDAGEYSSEQMDAVLAASQAFAADSGAMETAARRNGQAIQVSGTAAGDAATSTMTFDEALRKVQSSSSDATAQATPFTDALKGLRGAASEADAAAQFLYLTLIEMAGGQVTAEQATRANEAAFREIGNSARDYAEAQQKVADKEAELADLSNHLGEEYKGQTVTQADLDRASRELADAKSAVADADDRQFQAGTKAAESAAQMASQAYVTKAAQGDLAGGVADATRIMEEQRQKFIDAQAQINGGNIPAAEELANKLGLIPANVQTTFTQKGGADALKQAQDLNAALDLINNKTVRYYVVNGSTIQLDAPSTTGGGASSTDYLRALAGHADGGWVSGPGGPRDDMVKARLSPGEFVVNAAQAGKHPGLLEAINAGELGFADGGSVPGPAAGAAVSASAGAAVSVTAPDPAIFEAAWTAIAKAAQDAWATVILPVMDAMSARNAQSGVEFTALAELVQAQQQGVIQPTFDALNLGAQGVGTWQQWLAAVWAQSWQANQDRTAAGVAAVSASEAALAAATDAAWSSIGARIQGTYDGQIIPAWSGVQSFAAQVGGFFAGMQSSVSGATDVIVGDVGEIKSTLQDFFAVVDGRVTPQLANGGSVADALAGAFADGGPITVGTGPRSDDVLIRVSRGEYVVNAAATAKHRDTLDAINNGTAAFADGGLVGDKVQAQMVAGMQQSVGDAVSKVLAALSVNVAGFNPSQDPSSFGWQRAQGIVPFSWNGNPILGGVAAGTERLWTSLLDFLVPKIPGGLTEPMYGYENRDNVNSPGRASFHAYGLATDINAGANPNGVPIGSRLGAGVIPTGPARQIAGKLGMLWGGDFGGTPDSMHFEIHVPPGLIGGLGEATSFAAGPGWKQSVLDAIGKAKQNALAPPPTSSGDPSRSSSAGVEQWRGLGLQVLRNVGNYLGRDLTGYIDNMLLQISTESSGNPNAINLTDSNAMRGTPSKGLMQVIDPTAATALRGTPFEYLLSRGMFDPEANMTASTLYGLVTGPYHDLAKAWRGVAYAGGGLVAGPGGPFDDKIPARLSNGEFVVNARSTAANLPMLQSINSGNQFPFTREQLMFNAMAAQAVPQRAGGTIRIEFAGDGAITAEMLRTARVTVDGAFDEYGMKLELAGAQG